MRFHAHYYEFKQTNDRHTDNRLSIELSYMKHMSLEEVKSILFLQ